MQIDPQQSVSMVLNTIDGSQLELEPGRSVVARVVTGTDAGGSARISLAGQMLDVSSVEPLQAGQTIRLTVQSTSTNELRLALIADVPHPPTPPATSLTSTDAGRASRPSQAADIVPRGSPAAGASAPRDAVIVPAGAGTAPISTQGTQPAHNTAPHSGVPATSPSPSPTAAAQTQQRGGIDMHAAAAQSVVSADQSSTEPVALPTAASRTTIDVKASAMQELVRAGVPATNEMVRAAARAIETLMHGDAPAISDTGTASRVVANLAARALPVSDAVATRVAAALDTAGRVGAQLHELARVDGRIAHALPSGSPSAAALRGLLASQIPPAELAIARIAQAQVAASQAQAATPGAAPVALPEPTASPQVVSNFIASQLARASSLDELASSSHQTSNQQSNNPPQPTPGADTRARQATVQGTASQPLTSLPQAAQPQAAQPAAALPASGTPIRSDVAAGSTSIDRAPLSPAVSPEPGRATISATASTPSAAPQAAADAPSAESAAAPAGAPTPATPRGVAQVIANLGIAVTRLAPAMINTAVAGDPELAAVQQQIIARGEAAAAGFTPESEGGGGTAVPAPLVSALRSLLNADQPTEALTSQLAQYDADDIAHALQHMPQRDALRIAGRMLELMPHPGALSAEAAGELQDLVHDILTHLGRTLRPAPDDELSMLRQVLHQVATSEARPHVALAAQQVLDMADGQLILSQPRHGADPGYVWFTAPMPGNRHAEVLVRREPGRREVSFDTFNMAFLLDTASLGTLMITMEAHPGAIRALVRTDRPDMEPVIAAHAEELREPLERAARRPLVFNTGVLDAGETPPTLFEPELGLIPGENAFYA